MAASFGKMQVTVVLDNTRYNHSTELRAWLGQPACRLRLV